MERTGSAPIVGVHSRKKTRATSAYRAVYLLFPYTWIMGSKREFGSGGRTFRRGFNRKLGSTRANTSLQRYGLPTGSGSEPTVLDQRFENIRKLDEIESRFGFYRYKEGPERLGWLINMHEVQELCFANFCWYLLQLTIWNLLYA